jgi:hypothetical protein
MLLQPPVLQLLVLRFVAVAADFAVTAAAGEPAITPHKICVLFF